MVAQDAPEIDSDGTFDVVVNLKYPPTPGEISDIKSSLRDEADRLWDATDGQFTYGKITIETTDTNEDTADYWVYPHSGTPYANMSGYGIKGEVVKLYAGFWGHTFTHEAGHYFWGLSDEYAANKCLVSGCPTKNTPGCGGKRIGVGLCIEPTNTSKKRHCIMHSRDQGFRQNNLGTVESSSNEFCTSSTHDKQTGNMPVDSDDRGSNCPDSTGSSTIDCRYCPSGGQTLYVRASTQETAAGQSCFEEIAGHYNNVSAPGGDPNVAPPKTDRPALNFVDKTQYAESTILMLDRSYSMTRAKNADAGANVEICDNGIDDDGNDGIDESDCQDIRMKVVREAAKGWLQLAKGLGQKAGIVSFSKQATYDKQLTEVDSSSISNFKSVIDSLKPGTSTAIGSAIERATNILSGTQAHRAGLLVTDGKETESTDPEAKAETAKNKGIRIHTISTGQASNHPTLSDVAYATKARRRPCHNPKDLVACFAQSFAQMQNWPILIPKLRYEVNSQGEYESFDLGENSWVENSDEFPAGDARKNTLEFRVPGGTSELKFLVSSTNGNFDRFDVDFELHDPNGNVVTSNSSTSNWSVTNEKSFILGEFQSPAAGTWTFSIEGTPRGASLQTGNITAIAVNDTADLFVDTKPVEPGNGDPVTLRVSPLFETTLNDLKKKKVVVEAPDGTQATYTLSQGTDSFPIGRGDVSYKATIPDFAGQAGTYDIRVLAETGSSTWNQPGEPVFDSPSNARPIPEFKLGRTASFFRKIDEDHSIPENMQGGGTEE